MGGTFFQDEPEEDNSQIIYGTVLMKFDCDRDIMNNKIAYMLD